MRVCTDWTEHGPAAIAEVRAKNPTAYVRIVASLVQRGQPETALTDFSEYTYEN
jgi:hypothetical protein